MDISRQDVIELRMPTGAKAIIVGTAHVCNTSPQLVARVIKSESPDCVAVELCAFRAAQLAIVRGAKATSDADTLVDQSGRQAFSPWDAKQVFPGIIPMAAQLMTGMMMASLAHILERDDQSSAASRAPKASAAVGAEMSVAATEAIRAGATLAVIDRGVTVTFARAGSELGLKDVWSALPTALACVQLPPNFTPSVSHMYQLFRSHASGDWHGVASAARDVMHAAEAARPDFACSTAGKAYARFNRLILDVVESGGCSFDQKRVLSSAFTAAVEASDPEACPELAADLPKAITEERDIVLAAGIKAALAHAESRARPGHGSAGHSSVSSPSSTSATPGAPVTGENTSMLGSWTHTSCPPTVVAVVGRSHLPGIARAWSSPTSDPASVQLQELLRPPPFHTARAIGLPVAATVVYMGSIVHSLASRRFLRASALAAVGAGAAAGAAFVADRSMAVMTRVKDAMTASVS